VTAPSKRGEESTKPIKSQVKVKNGKIDLKTDETRENGYRFV